MLCEGKRRCSPTQTPVVPAEGQAAEHAQDTAVTSHRGRATCPSRDLVLGTVSLFFPSLMNKSLDSGLAAPEMTLTRSHTGLSLSSVASSLTWAGAPAGSARLSPPGRPGGPPAPGRSLWFPWHRRLAVGKGGPLTSAGRPAAWMIPEGALLTLCPTKLRLRPFPAFVANKRRSCE